MLPPAAAVQPEPMELDPPPPVPPAKAGAGRGAPAEPAGVLEDGVGALEEAGLEAGVLGVPKPPPLLPPKAVAI